MITGLQEGQELLVGGSNGFQSPSTPANLNLSRESACWGLNLEDILTLFRLGIRAAQCTCVLHPWRFHLAPWVAGFVYGGQKRSDR